MLIEKREIEKNVVNTLAVNFFPLLLRVKIALEAIRLVNLRNNIDAIVSDLYPLLLKYIPKNREVDDAN